MQYYLHEGYLWRGPTSPEDTLHWAKFHGFMRVQPYEQIWVAERTYAHPDAKFMSVEEAMDILHMMDNHDFYRDYKGG